MTGLLIAFAVIRGILLRPITWAHLAWLGGGEQDTSWLIRRQIDSMRSTGGTMRLPVGSFRLSAPVTLPPNTTVRGS